MKFKLKKTKFLLLNYFTTKFYFFNILNIIHILKNKKLKIKKSSRMNYSYGSLSFNIKIENWIYIYKKVYSFLYKEKNNNLINFIYYLDKNFFFNKYNNINYKKLEYLAYNNLKEVA